MAEITLTPTGGAPVAVTSLSLILPRVGMWTADVALDAAAGPTGACVLALDGLSWAGGVVRGAVVDGVWRGRLAGSPALLGAAPATALRGATLALVLRDLAAAVGVGLASDLGALDAAAPSWHRHEGQASQAVADVARAAGYPWRVRADGLVWMGPETWPTFAPAAAVDVLDELAEAGRLTLGGDVLGILPGQTLALRGRDPLRVGGVEHRATADDLQTVVLADHTPTERGGLLAALERLRGRLSRRVDYAGLYPARVVEQRGDGTLDLVPDSARVAPCQAVPYRTLRGLSVDVPAGARVLLGYEGADPSRPYALAWELGDATAVRVNGGSTRAAREGDSVSVTIPAGAVLVSSPGGPVPSPAPITLTGTITSGTTALRLP